MSPQDRRAVALKTARLSLRAERQAHWTQGLGINSWKAKLCVNSDANSPCVLTSLRWALFSSPKCSITTNLLNGSSLCDGNLFQKRSPPKGSVEHNSVPRVDLALRSGFSVFIAIQEFRRGSCLLASWWFFVMLDGDSAALPVNCLIVLHPHKNGTCRFRNGPYATFTPSFDLNRNKVACSKPLYQNRSHWVLKFLFIEVIL